MLPLDVIKWAGLRNNGKVRLHCNLTLADLNDGTRADSLDTDTEKHRASFKQIADIIEAEL